MVYLSFEYLHWFGKCTFHFLWTLLLKREKWYSEAKSSLFEHTSSKCGYFPLSKETRITYKRIQKNVISMKYKIKSKSERRIAKLLRHKSFLTTLVTESSDRACCYHCQKQGAHTSTFHQSSRAVQHSESKKGQENDHCNTWIFLMLY